MTEPQGDPEAVVKNHYLQAARQAVGRMLGVRLTIYNTMAVAAEAAVLADRQRMAEQLRHRIMNSQMPQVDVGVMDYKQLNMKLDELMFAIAEQIESGMVPRQ